MKTLIIIIIFLMSGICSGQQDTARKYYFNSSEMKKFAEWKIENNFLKSENARLVVKDSVNTLFKLEQSIKINSLTKIIEYKNKEIETLLNESKEIIEVSQWKWYEIGGICLSSFAIGILTGILTK